MTTDNVPLAVQHLYSLFKPRPSPHPPSYATTLFGRVDRAHFIAYPHHPYMPDYVRYLFAFAKCYYVAEVKGASVQRVLADDRALQRWLNDGPVTDVVDTVADALRNQDDKATQGWAFIRESGTLLGWASTKNEMGSTLQSMFRCMPTTQSPPVLPTLGELSFLPTFMSSPTPETFTSPELPIVEDKPIHTIFRKTCDLPTVGNNSPLTDMVNEFRDMWSSDSSDANISSSALPRLTISLAEISPPPFTFDIEPEEPDDMDVDQDTMCYPPSIPSSPDLSFSASSDDDSSSMPPSPESALLALPKAKHYRGGRLVKASPQRRRHSIDVPQAQKPVIKKGRKRTRASDGEDDNDDDYLPKRSVIHTRKRRSPSSSPPSAPLLTLAALPDVTLPATPPPRPSRPTAPLPRRARQCAEHGDACGCSSPSGSTKKPRGASRKSKKVGRFPCPAPEQGCKLTFTRLKDAVRHWTFSCKCNAERLCVICPGCKKNLSRPDAASRHQNASQCQGTGEIAVLLEHAKEVMLAVEETIVRTAARAAATGATATGEGLDAQDDEDIGDDDEEE